VVAVRLLGSETAVATRSKRTLRLPADVRLLVFGRDQAAEMAQ
jgi:hypothetical protein